eukprot:5261256-Pleurochrysis_carterae.AAC.3
MRVLCIALQNVSTPPSSAQAPGRTALHAFTGQSTRASPTFVYYLLRTRGKIEYLKGNFLERN